MLGDRDSEVRRASTWLLLVLLAMGGSAAGLQIVAQHSAIDRQQVEIHHLQSNLTATAGVMEALVKGTPNSDLTGLTQALEHRELNDETTLIRINTRLNCVVRNLPFAAGGC